MKKKCNRNRNRNEKFALCTYYAEAERHTTPVVAACYNTLQPVVALAVMTALGEGPPGARNLLGSGLIVLGGLAAVALSTNDRRRWKAVIAAEVAATTARRVIQITTRR